MYVCMYDYIAVSTRTLTPPTTGKSCAGDDSSCRLRAAQNISGYIPRVRVNVSTTYTPRWQIPTQESPGVHANLLDVYKFV